MTGRQGPEQRWSVGELARATGLTVRALHHYDDIGLVTASERTAAGHRRYAEADLRRLYRVRALRGLGLSLEEIATVLARDVDDVSALRAVLEGQLAHLDEQAVRVSRLREQVAGLLASLDEGMPGPERFTATLEAISRMDDHYTPAQQDLMARKRTELGPAAIEAMKVEWFGLARRLMGLQAQDVPVDDPRVQEMTKRWDEIGTAFHGGDTAIVAATDAAYEGSKESLNRQLGWPAPGDGPDLVDYVRRAREART
ncbi:MerR family transcriptional regulator [Umezawaea tangerina]|uniref:DNA-binding transcriptional MerR regulator n=1 Tax=Umezawaea tangerina TaxID=84725 RepID=A0A2T0SXH2_9PSEU|nr:MerR family transcriptional regulator [Umezawaea tangerina]PRY38116.1 DNA-binding transcriptional MerR regulator [Umezawaea tangerina]